jgi:hypothetical protein
MTQKGNLPENIPSNPNRSYAGKGWCGFGVWLGTGNIATYQRDYRSFKKARSFARSLNLRNNFEWRQFCLRNLPLKGFLPNDIPSTPDRVYKNKGWAGYGD